MSNLPVLSSVASALDNPPPAAPSLDELFKEEKVATHKCPLCLETKPVVSSPETPDRSLPNTEPR